MLVIGLCGMPSSGKSTVGVMLAQNYNANYYSLSQVLGEILDLLAIERDRESFTKLAMALIGAFGQGVVSRKIVKEVQTLRCEGPPEGQATFWKEQDSILIVVIEAVPLLRTAFPDFKLVAVQATFKERYERAKAAGKIPPHWTP